MATTTKTTTNKKSAIKANNTNNTKGTKTMTTTTTKKPTATTTAKKPTTTKKATTVKKVLKTTATKKPMLTTETKGLHITAVSNATIEKHKNQEIKKSASEQIKLLNTKIFKLVNEDYKNLATHNNFINASKLQKMNHLKSLYKNKDSMYNIVVTIKEMNLSVPNDLTQGQYNTIIKGVKKGFISKSAVSRLNSDNVKSELSKVNKLLNSKK